MWDVAACGEDFFFNDAATAEIYTLSLHDALPIWPARRRRRGDRADPGILVAAARGVPDHAGAVRGRGVRLPRLPEPGDRRVDPDRKSTRLNSSHANISYAVFCLKKKTTYSVRPSL